MKDGIARDTAEFLGLNEMNSSIMSFSTGGPVPENRIRNRQRKDWHLLRLRPSTSLARIQLMLRGKRMTIRRPPPVEEREEEEVWRSQGKMVAWNQRVVSRLLIEDCLGPGLKVDSAKFQVTYVSKSPDRPNKYAPL